MSKARKPQRRSEWQPLARGVNTPPSPAHVEALIAEARQSFDSVDADGAEAFIRDQLARRQDDEVWLNDLVVVHVERGPDGNVISLSIRRQDRKPLRDWRVMQQIKNELAGYDTEAVELFPADDRLVDTANQYWLWCLPPGQRFGFGFPARAVASSAGSLGSNARQRAGEMFHTAGPVLG